MVCLGGDLRGTGSDETIRPGGWTLARGEVLVGVAGPGTGGIGATGAWVPGGDGGAGWSRLGAVARGGAARPRLTAREIEALNDAAGGLTVAGSAVRRGKSRATVNQELKLARERLGASSTTQAVAMAVRWGLIP